MARGLMVYPMGGTVDGTRGDHVLLAPPFIIDGAAIDTIVERLGDAIDAATASDMSRLTVRAVGIPRRCEPVLTAPLLHIAITNGGRCT